MSKDKHAGQLDRIEAKLDEVLAFKDTLEKRIEALLGKSGEMAGQDGGLLSGPLGTIVGGLLARSGNGAPKSG